MIKLILRGIKKNKKSFIGLFSCITITTVVLTLLICFFSSQRYTQYMDEKEKNGTYSYVIDHITDVQKEKKEQYLNISDSNTISIYGTYEYGLVGAIDQTNLLPLQLEEGRLPKNQNEVAIGLKQLFQLGYTEESLGHEIEVEYQLLDESTQKETLTLCGILDDYYTVCTHPNMIISNRDYASEDHLFFTGEINYTRIYEDFDKTEDESMLRLFDNNTFVNPTKYIPIQKGIEFMRIVVLMFVAFMISLMNMQRIVQNQRNDILLLRGIGAKKGQIVSMILGEAVIVLILSLLSGSLLGLLISQFMIKMNHYAFYLEKELFIESLIISSLPLIFAVIFPTISALNVSLTGRLNKKIKRVHSNVKGIINIPFLMKRRIQQNLSKYIIYSIASIIALAFSIQFYYKIVNQNIFEEVEYKQYLSDYLVSTEYTKDYDELVHSLQKSVNLKEVQIESLYFDDIQLDHDIKYKVWDMNISEYTNRGRLTIDFLDFYQSAYLLDLGIDEKEYRNGNIAILYAPKVVQSKDSKENSKSKVYNRLFDALDHVDVIQEDTSSIKNVNYNGKNIQIGAVIEKLDGILIENRNAIQPFTIFMSSNNISQEQMGDVPADYYISTNDLSYSQLTKAKIGQLFDSMDTIISFGRDRENELNAKKEEQLETFMYLLPLFSFFILIINEMINDIENTRKTQVDTYHLVGLTYQNILKLVSFDIGVFIGIVSIVGTILGLYLSINQFNPYFSPIKLSLIEKIRVINLYPMIANIALIAVLGLIIILSIIVIRSRILRVLKNSIKEQSKDH